MFGWKKKAKEAGREAAAKIGMGAQFAKNGPLTIPDATLLSAGEVVVPEVVLPYSGQVPSFDGIDDTMGFSSFDGGSNPMSEDYGIGPGSCAYCGSFGAHKPDCKSLRSNWGNERGSLGTQRAMTSRLRNEMTQSFTGGVSSAGAQRASDGFGKPEPDTRTELQKRFDEIAAELADGEK